MIVHTLVTSLDNAAWMIAVLFVITRVLMAWLLHSLWMDAGAAIGFGEGLSGAALTPKRLSIGVLFVWLCSVVADAATGAYDSNRFDHQMKPNVVGIIGLH